MTQIVFAFSKYGDTKSLIIHPSSTTHQQLSEEQLTSGFLKI
jgi:O-acetylhomoserine (thiol)-lyase